MAMTCRFRACFCRLTSILNTGPTEDPEFHLKARATRFGANLEWPDMSSKIVLTGRIEGDYEGNFSEVDNRDVSSIRSSMIPMRLAWAAWTMPPATRRTFTSRADRTGRCSDPAHCRILWKPPSWRFWYGNVYERSPQLQLGLLQRLGKDRTISNFHPLWIMMPSTGQIVKLGTRRGLQRNSGKASARAPTPVVPSSKPDRPCSSSSTKRQGLRQLKSS